MKYLFKEPLMIFRFGLFETQGHGMQTKHEAKGQVFGLHAMSKGLKQPKTGSEFEVPILTLTASLMKPWSVEILKM